MVDEIAQELRFDGVEKNRIYNSVLLRSKKRIRRKLKLKRMPL